MTEKLTIRESLNQLERWFRLGLTADTKGLREGLLRLQSQPVAIVGSGASYSTATFLARCLEAHLNCPSKPVPPFDYGNIASTYRAAIMISTRGQNPDILAAQAIALTRQVNPLILITSDSDSPLRRASEDYPGRVVALLPRDPQGKEDGFLGVVSLGAMWAFITKTIYELVGWRHDSLADDLSRAVATARLMVGREAPALREIGRRSHIVALGTGWALPAVTDFESKLVEGGLGWVEAAEAKHFTHGRFVNCYRQGGDSAILVFSTAEDVGLAEKVKESFGEQFPVHCLRSEHSGMLGAIELLVQGLWVVDNLGATRGIDVSRPVVTQEARRMYRGDGLYLSATAQQWCDDKADEITAHKRVVAAREQLDDPAQVVPRAVVRAAYSAMFQTHFGGLLCDFDGTLVPLESGRDTPDAEIVSALRAIIRQGVPLAIATGRGRSALRGLRLCIAPALQSRVLCFLYNGAACYRLDCDDPEWVLPLDRIEQIADELRGLGGGKEILDIEIASLSCQVTIRLAHRLDGDQERSLLRHVLERVPAEASVRCSGRSIDVSPRGCSKLKALQAFQRLLGEAGQGLHVLAIGDRGDRIGNDYELLQEQFSISVDRFDWTPSTCFPSEDVLRAVTGPMSAVRLLSRVDPSNGGFRLRCGVET